MPKAAMMRQQLPSLDLSPQDVKTLGDLATSLVQHNLGQRDSLLVTRDGMPDSRAWRELQRKEGVRVFREQRPGAFRMAAGTSASLTAGGELTLGGGDTSKLPSLLLVATLAGSLDDVMFAAATPTNSAMRVKSQFIQDGVVDAKVLTKLVPPGVDDPFHSLSVTWRYFTVSEQRDFTCVDASGLVDDPRTGERVGYHLVHSLDFDHLPTFSSHGVERANMSVCTFFRQRDANIVECFARGFFDFHSANDMLNNVALHVISTQWLSAARLMELAHMKKLMWCIKEHTGRASFSSSSHSSGSSSGATRAATNSGAATPAALRKVASRCTICSRSFGGLMRVAPKFCACCSNAVCKRCCVKRRVCAVSTRDQAVHERKMVFCGQCTTEASKCRATVVARDELLARSSSMSSTRQTALED